jgi:DNA invertase Pin-like site-specific DNA recombinase
MTHMNETSRLIGCCRVSTTDGRQKTDLQRDALAKAGVDILYEDHCSGAKTSRPDLDRCLAELREGDTLVIWRLDRLGRSLPHLLDVVADLTTAGCTCGPSAITSTPARRQGGWCSTCWPRSPSSNGN